MTPFPSDSFQLTPNLPVGSVLCFLCCLIGFLLHVSFQNTLSYCTTLPTVNLVFCFCCWLVGWFLRFFFSFEIVSYSVALI